jgi:hypothetical protein
MTQNNKVLLNICERKILENVYTSVIEQWMSTIRTNQELRELYETSNLVAEIKRRLAWLGNVIDWIKQVWKDNFESKSKGRRKGEREPRLRLVKDVENDLHVWAESE